MDLKLASGDNSNIDIYINQLATTIDGFSKGLSERDIWDKNFVTISPCFVNEYTKLRSPLRFDGIPKILALELKLYWARLLSDERYNAYGHISRRMMPMKWFSTNGPDVLAKFGASCLSDIPHPEFPLEGHKTSIGKRQHNQDYLDMYESFRHNSSLPKQQLEVVTSNVIKKMSYRSSRISVAGDFHKKIIIYRDQFKPVKHRNIIFLNDLYSEENIRFKDQQRQNDQYINLYLFPTWLRQAIKEHVLQKVTHGELGPKTLKCYLGRLCKFRDFMYEQFPNPTPEYITDVLIEDKFIAWGNQKELSGKNWYTEAVAMLNTASHTWPDQWPALSTSMRAARKIRKTHYKQGLGRIGHNQECANRFYSKRIIDEISQAAKSTPKPIFNVYGIVLGIGARAEDGHAILFDCLTDDPNDKDFMLLTFWQSKVRKWNIKPLLKNDDSHKELIEIIERQRSAILEKHGKPTKYLFPVFNGTKESFISPSYTTNEIKRQCVLSNIRLDDGSPLSFSWHSLRHTKGTSLAKDGHDILSIMMELGHTSPDMAAVYINNRLELKKKALLENGSGRFYTIEGNVDERISELLVRKEQINATRVCGGACAMPSQIGDWCEHANACYICKYFRADAKDIQFFRDERAALGHIIEDQQEEAMELQDNNRERMSLITQRRLKKNKEVYKSLDILIKAIEIDGSFDGGDKQQCKMQSLDSN